MLLVFSTLLFKVTPIGVESGNSTSSRIGFQNTYTVMPALKTKHKADFKKEWEQKKDEAVLDFLKN